MTDPQYFYLTVDGLLKDNFKTERLLKVEVDQKAYEVEAHDLSISIGRD